MIERFFVAKNKSQKKKERAVKIRKNREYVEQMQQEHLTKAMKSTSFKLYMLGIIVVLAGFFIFYNMR